MRVKREEGREGREVTDEGRGREGQKGRKIME